MLKPNKKICLFLLALIVLRLLFNVCYKYFEPAGHETFFYSLKDADCRTKRLKLSLTTQKHAEILSEYLKDKEVSTMLIPSLFFTEGFASKEAAEKYIKTGLIMRDNIYMFTILRTAEDGNLEPIGQISFDCSKKGILWISYWLGKKFHRKGYMSEVVPLIKKYFDECDDFEQIHIQCLYKNKGSAAICERICKLFAGEEKKYKIITTKDQERYDGQLTTVKKYDIYKIKNKINPFS